MEVETSLTVHIQPRAKRSEVVGWHGDAIKIRICAPPIGGAANVELIRFVAKAAGVPKKAVRIASGTTSRHKRLHVRGVSEAHLFASLGIASE
jgi:uncharacterized protein (TIGR00251 family)